MRTWYADELEKLSREDWALVECFGDLDTCLAETAHLVMRCDCKVLDEITALFDCVAGLWPTWIEYDAQGAYVYGDPYDGEVPFTDWALPQNQEVLRSWMRGTGASFRMCLDCRVDVEVLRPLAEAMVEDPSGQSPPVLPCNADYLAMVPSVIDDVKWIYCQIGDNYPYSICVVSRSCEASVDALAAWCVQTGRPHAKIVRVGHRVRWQHYPQNGKTVIDDVQGSG